MKNFNREAIQRMFDGRKGGGGGGTNNADLAGYATQMWVNQNYVSIEFFNRLFSVHGHDPEDESTPPTDISVLPNDMDSIIDSIESMVGFYTEEYLSALGLNPDSGSGNATTLYELLDVKPNSDVSPSRVYGLEGTSADNGKVLTYSTTYGKWIAAANGAGSGTVTSIDMTVPTGFSVSGAPITTYGTLAVTFGGSIAKNKVLASPANATGSPDWRTLVASDIPDLSATYASASDVTTLQGYFDNLGNANSANKLAVYSKTAWGQTYWTSGGVPDNISGDMTSVGDITASSNGTKDIKGFRCLEMYGAASSNFGGYIDFHYNNDSGDYTSRIIEDASGVLKINNTIWATLSGDVGVGTSTTYTKLTVNGGVKTTKLYLYKPNTANDTNAVYFEYDSANAGVHLVGAGFYGNSYISALGLNSQGGGGSITLNEPLNGINNAGLSAPTSSASGQTVVWNGSAWTYSINTTLRAGAIATTGGASIYGNVESSVGDFIVSAGHGFKIANSYSDEVLLADGTKSKLKTVNGYSLFGSGNIDASGGGSGNYLPLAGGTMTGNILYNDSLNSGIEWLTTYNGGFIRSPFRMKVGSLYYGMAVMGNVDNYLKLGSFNDMYGQGNDTNCIFLRPDDVPRIGSYQIWHSGNLNPYDYLLLTGGTLTGNLHIGAIGNTSNLNVIFRRNGDSYFVGSGDTFLWLCYRYEGDSANDNNLCIYKEYSIFNKELRVSGNLTASSFIKSGGTSSQFLKADGSVDATSYLPTSGGSLTGDVTFGGEAAFRYIRTGTGWFRTPFRIENETYFTGINLYNSNGVIYTKLGIFTDKYGQGNDTNCIKLYPNSYPTVGSSTIWHAGNFTPSDYLLSTDISAWAKASTKPSYNLDEVPDGTTRKLADYVTLATSQTITGTKYFQNNIYIKQNANHRYIIFQDTGNYAQFGYHNTEGVIIHNYVADTSINLRNNGLVECGAGLKINGTLTGCTSIDSLLYFDTTNSRIGVGVSAPDYGIDAIGGMRLRNSTSGTGSFNCGVFSDSNNPYIRMIDLNGSSVDIKIATVTTQGNTIYPLSIGDIYRQTRIIGQNVRIYSRVDASSTQQTPAIITTYGGRVIIGSDTTLHTNNADCRMSVSGSLCTAEDDGTFIKIGQIYIGYDSSNTALKVYKKDSNNNIIAANFYATGAVSALGANTSGGGASDYIPLSGSTAITGSLVPATDNTYDLGSSTKTWGTIYANSIAGNASLSVQGISCTTFSVGARAVISSGAKFASIYIESDSSGNVSSSHSGEINRDSNNLHLQYANGTGGVTMCRQGFRFDTSTDGGGNNLSTISTSNRSLRIELGTATLNPYISKPWNEGSDIRRKDIIANVSASIESIADAPIFNFRYKGDLAECVNLGTSAQYWRNVFPCGVTEMGDGYLAMSYGSIALAAAVVTARKVQNHEDRIRELEERLSLSEAENKALREEIELLKAA